MGERIILLGKRRKLQRCSHHCGQAILEQATQKGDIICHLLPFKACSALEHPHFTFLPVPTETATLPPPQIRKVNSASL